MASTFEQNSGPVVIRIIDGHRARRIRYGEDIDAIFNEFPEKLIKRLANICEHYLCCSGDYNDPVLRCLRFTNCNGADLNGGMSFSEAYCSVKPIKGKNQVIGSVFQKGLGILLRYTDTRHVPENFAERLLLGKLLHYLVNSASWLHKDMLYVDYCVPFEGCVSGWVNVEDTSMFKLKMAVSEIQAPLKSLTDLTEKELSIVVTNHLFGQLSTTSRFLINVNNSGPKTCPCNTGCDSPCSFGDTSIGNEEVWHGNMDVILNQEVAINTVNDESNPSTSDPGNSDPGHFSSHVRRLSRNSEFIAKTVSFSFLQRQSRPEISLSLFPCISITSNGLVLDFYDSNHDVLLESSAIPFIIPGKESTSRTISLTMIIVAWLAVNYRYLSSGLPATLKYEAAKAGFFEQAGDKLRVYRGELKLGNVRDSVCFNDDSDSDVESPEFLSEIRARLYNIAKGKGVGRDGDAIYISHSNQ